MEDFRDKYYSQVLVGYRTNNYQDKYLFLMGFLSADYLLQSHV